MVKTFQFWKKRGDHDQQRISPPNGFVGPCPPGMNFAGISARHAANFLSPATQVSLTLMSAIASGLTL